MIILKKHFFLVFDFQGYTEGEAKIMDPNVVICKGKLWDPAYLLAFVVESYVRLVWVLPPPRMPVTTRIMKHF